MQPQNNTPTSNEPTSQNNVIGDNPPDNYSNTQNGNVNSPSPEAQPPAQAQNIPATPSFSQNPTEAKELSTPPVQESPAVPPSVHPTPISRIDTAATHETDLVPDKPHNIRKLLIIVALILVAAGAGLAYWAYSSFGAGDSNRDSAVQEQEASSEAPEIETVAVADLVEARTASATYQYPKTWYPVSGSGISGYESPIQNTGGLRSRVIANISEPTPDGIALASAPAGDVARVREQLIGAITKETAASSLQESGVRCTLDVTLKVTPDTSVSETNIGMYYSEVSCAQSEDDVVSQVHFVLGKDGRTKLLMILASRSTWDKSEEAFTQMLNSIK